MDNRPKTMPDKACDKLAVSRGGGSDLQAYLPASSQLFMKHVPNILSLARIALTPLFLVLFLGGTFTTQLAATLLFSALAISDWLDGHLARRYGLSSRFGQYIDPLADKVLVLGAFVALMFLGGEQAIIPSAWWWIPIGFIAVRDFGVTWLRTLAEKQGKSIQTKNAAKIKTAVQLTFLITLQVFLALSHLDGMSGFWGFLGMITYASVYSPAPGILLVLTAILTVWTGAQYFRTDNNA